MAHLVDKLVNGRIFLDIGVAGRDIGLRLVIIVIADKILHAIVREQGFELVVKLGCQGFVRGDDQAGPLHLVDDVGHGECFAGTGHPQKDLVFFIVHHSLGQVFNGLGLVACGRKFRYQIK